MQTFTFETAYDDFPEGGTRADMVIAPDRETAIRLAAKQTLEDNEWTLQDRSCKSLKDFYDSDEFGEG